MNRIDFAWALVLAACTPIAAMSQGETPCVLSGNLVKPSVIFENQTIEVALTLTQAPAYLDAVPARVGQQGDCRLHISPSAAGQQFRIRYQPTILMKDGTVDTARVSLQLIPQGAGQPALDVLPIEVKGGDAAVTSIRLPFPMHEASEFDVALVVTRLHDGRRVELPFKLLWTPPVSVDLSSPLPDCPASALCLMQDVEGQVGITGNGLTEVDATGQVIVELDGFAVKSARPQVQLGSSNVPAFKLTVNEVKDGGIKAQIPLSIPRLISTNGGVQEMDRIVLEKGLRVRARGLSEAELQMEDGTILQHMTVDALPKVVRFQVSDSGLQNFFKAQKKYEVREWSVGDGDGKLIAEFSFTGYDASRAVGVLRPLSTTTRQPRYNAPPRLVVTAEGNRKLLFSLIILPQQVVNRYAIIRNGVESLAGSIYPTEQVELRVDGPAAAYISKATLGGATLTKKPGDSRDSLWFQSFKVPLNVDGTAVLRMWGIDSVEIPAVTIPVVSAARPLTSKIEEFAWLGRRVGSTIGRLDVDQGVYDTLPDLRGIVLRADPEKIEPGSNELAGVQYLRLSLRLTDYQGREHGTDTVCLAVVPPPVNGRAYVYDSNCTRVTGEFAVSDLIDATYRATQQSMLQIDLGHDLAKYTVAAQPNTKTVRLVRKGKWPFTPSVALPGMMVTFQPSRNWRGGTAVAYTGAMLGVQPLVRGFRARSGLSLTLSGGFVMKTPPEGQAPSSSMAVQLSAIAAASIKILDMSGKVSFDLMAGYVQPLDQGIRWRHGLVVLYPGFKITP